ncbi:MAG: hypothetical protein QOH31_4522 [Verrucomicrobiota bacterium]|jgi:hypothetical protein
MSDAITVESSGFGLVTRRASSAWVAELVVCAIRLKVVFSLNKYRRRTILPTEFVSIA